jgi:hypothetical protein
LLYFTNTPRSYRHTLFCRSASLRSDAAALRGKANCSPMSWLDGETPWAIF